MKRERSARILATLGPASATRERILALAQAGATVHFTARSAARCCSQAARPAAGSATWVIGFLPTNDLLTFTSPASSSAEICLDSAESVRPRASSTARPVGCSMKPAPTGWAWSNRSNTTTRRP